MNIKKHIAVGNRKIGKDTAIFNIGPAATCAADKLGLCNVSKQCYAKKAERLYPQVLPYRLRQTEIWDNFTSGEIADAIGTRAKRLKYFRFNESGDFRNQSDVSKMRRVANILYSKYAIKTYGYTARLDLDLSSNCDHFIITMSGQTWPGYNSFIPVKSFSGDHLECIGDCSKCILCKFQHGKIIECKIH